MQTADAGSQRERERERRCCSADCSTTRSRL
jgi:hypothetical protein